MNHISLIALWPSLAELSADTGEKIETVRKWKQRGQIPLRAWPRVTEAAQQRKLKGITLENLMAGVRR